MTKEDDILQMLINQAKVREIKEKLHTGAEKINKVRLANQDKYPKIKVKKKTGTRTKIKKQEQEQEQKYDIITPSKSKFFETHIQQQSRMTETTLYFTKKEKEMSKQMFRAVIRQRAIKVQDEKEYQKLIDKITGD